MVPLGVKICSTVCLYLAHWSGPLAGRARACACVRTHNGKWAPTCASELAQTVWFVSVSLSKSFGRHILVCVCVLLSDSLLVPVRPSDWGQLLISTGLCPHTQHTYIRRGF